MEEWSLLNTATYCVSVCVHVRACVCKNFFGEERGKTGEKVSHQVLDVVAWERVGTIAREWPDGIGYYIRAVNVCPATVDTRAETFHTLTRLQPSL